MEDVIKEAKQLVTVYGKNVESQKLEELLAVLCDDASIHIPHTSALDGKEKIREFYESAFSTGKHAFTLEFTDEKIVSDLIFVNGRLDKDFTSPRSEEENNITHYDFSFILKKENDGLKIFQMRLA